ncbi:PHB depolymerase family esterase [Ideonella sp. A 288]|uniref:extracellular catalytic domain type 1 short-chain-length polyhydroxyalkanoate depolymerase n=1 Tax=Ideonella sp. A 288 TaxID=1962181 RepID=UPI000B4BF71C|nr:PHB depolymerase family esterase [Ideonella sp. A 288]
MNPTFQRWMARATELTRDGKLQRATEAIQAALAGVAARVGPRDADVIDVPAREVTPGGVAGAAPDVTTPPRPAPAPGQFIDGHHADAAAGSRDFKLYVPPGGPVQALPLVVMLHGCTQDAADFAAGTGMNDAAQARGFFVLYPEQSRSANPQRCWNWFKHSHQQRGRGEPALLAGMVREVVQRHGIDPRRVYVAGLSAGGAMAAILGDAYPELFAAVGVHSGLATGAAKDLGSALQAMRAGAPAAGPAAGRPPTIVFHGDRDTTVHPANGEHVRVAVSSGDASHTERARQGDGHDHTRQVYRDDNGRVVAEHWVVHGAGHAWSGGRAAGSFTDASGPDATDAMLRFFFSNSLPAADATQPGAPA